MTVIQVISARYIDWAKLRALLQTEFAGQNYHIESKDDSYILTIPRRLTDVR
ncbi:hypothetical protein BJY01DRAFT_246918 [Aspergillus pseudoustus]|uniref:Uncharacterized protein n=1 Tax=Aspergillus pseudoustus TaxID=1810923 RepID=A0ABR4K4I1_9EURO